METRSRVIREQTDRLSHEEERLSGIRTKVEMTAQELESQRINQKIEADKIAEEHQRLADERDGLVDKRREVAAERARIDAMWKVVDGHRSSSEDLARTLSLSQSPDPAPDSTLIDLTKGENDGENVTNSGEAPPADATAAPES